MAVNQQDSAQTPTWTEPPWSGWIETTGDALLILEAARRGLIPRVTRRLVDSERKMITSGSVFVFDEDESGIKRWTDGFFWSPSRILGNFLLYRETDKRGAGHRSARSDQSTSDSNDQSQYNVDGTKAESQSLSRPKGEKSQMGLDKHRERSLVGSLTNSYKFKPDGLMKKTFSLTIGGVSQHLISYYKIEDVEEGRLRSPSSMPELAALVISPEYLDKTHFRNPPKVEIVDGVPRYRGEADDIDASPTLLPGPLSSNLPLLSDPHSAEGSTSKRTKRFDPYRAPTPKRTRKAKGHSAQAPPADQQSQAITSTQQQPPHVYPDPNLSVVHHSPFHPYGMPSYYQMPGYAIPPPHHGPHLYPPNPYPGGPMTTPVPTQQGVAAAPQAPPFYAPYPAPSAMIDVSQPGQPPAQQPYYSYYPPPPHGHYPGYGGVAWPHYAGYPHQPIHQPMIVSSATVTEVENKNQTGMVPDAEGGKNEDV